MTDSAHVTNRFERFVANLELTSAQIVDGQTKYAGVVSCLNAAYYGHGSKHLNSFLIGSWAKDTKIRPPRDVDLYFVLPAAVYHRHEGYVINKQSALLQEVKARLIKAYPTSAIKGNGPVVVAGFATYNVEVVPAFALVEERAYWVCDARNGGSYKVTKPLHEVDALEDADLRNAGNVRRLIRMLKAWQAWCSVPLKSFYLELLAVEFLDKSQWRPNGYLYYHLICRDFFKFLITKADSFVFVPGTYDIVWLESAWLPRAQSAYGRAAKACNLEHGNFMLEAGDEWQRIFGMDIPRSV
ncbi:MAG: nucleotidyltransferase [Luteimonas sp.]|nr:nucleotidyltransferase [Luteimonas sp.]